VEVKLEAKAHVVAVERLERSAFLPEGVAPISLEQLGAVCKRSRHARRAQTELRAAVDAGRVFSRAEIVSLFDRSRAKGKPDADVACVVAYYADHHEKVLSREAKKEVRATLATVEWTALMLELSDFMAELREQEAAAAKERERKKEILEEDIKYDEKKRTFIKESGTIDERKKARIKAASQKSEDKKRLQVASERAVEDELTGSGTIPLTKGQSAQLQILKRGYANKPR
jgi:hypothetical protein